MQLWYSMIHDYTWVVLLHQISAFIAIKYKLAIIHMHCMWGTLVHAPQAVGIHSTSWATWICSSTSASLGLKEMQQKNVMNQMRSVKIRLPVSVTSLHPIPLPTVACFCEQPSALKAPATQRSWTLMIPTSTFKQWLLRQRCRRWISLWIPSCLVSAPIFMSNKTMAFLQMSCETKTLKKVCCWKTTFLLGQYIFRGYVKLQVGKYATSLLEMLRLLTWQN